MTPDIAANRRTVVKSLGTLAAAGAGGAFIATRTPAARADLAVGSIDVPDEQATLDDGEQVRDIAIALQCLWSYQLDPAPEAWQLVLKVGPDNEEIAATRGGGLSKQSDSGEVTLRGSLLDADAYDAQQFTPAEGDTVSVDVPVALTVRFYRDSDVVESATETATPTVTVEGPPLPTKAQIGAAGALTVTVE